MTDKNLGFQQKEQARQEKTNGVVNTIINKSVDESTLTPEQEEIARLKKMLEEAKKANEVQAYKKVETKTKRVNLLMYPSLYKALKEKCKRKGIKSMNDCINQLVRNYVNDEEN